MSKKMQKCAKLCKKKGENQKKIARMASPASPSFSISEWPPQQPISQLPPPLAYCLPPDSGGQLGVSCEKWSKHLMVKGVTFLVPSIGILY